MQQLEQDIDRAFTDRALLQQQHYRDAVLAAVAMLDSGEARVAEPSGGEWVIHGWLQKACVLYFSVAAMEVIDVMPYQFHDKVPLKRDLQAARVRVVPTGTVRYGAFLEPGVVVMPSFVNIGARVGSGTMVDTWATVGSCAQIGANVHLSGGVGIGGVLEPAGARPVIVEDGAFLGSRSIVVEGCMVGARAVLGANVVLTASTPIVDVTGVEPKVARGVVPAESVVIPGTMPKRFPAGEFQVPCALIIGRRKPSTDLKTSLNDTLREFAVSV
ncbi:MAG: 2,3,4,5-tetrahydropyridine-2,6-dicarboxylate N-succinyltransferase [Planctomycetes bacterium]|nr:2,3,4,5-tetrahydropyridine-2,6-dicarboxylate N-succinyltransferase [Planctomycetota bacterium]MCB9888854.1 2,3,4,5-tetrahydropyridine-2,6-dicarboxylate N-succinyltransferase [Planctomycetota bacterium]